MQLGLIVIRDHAKRCRHKHTHHNGRSNSAALSESSIHQSAPSANQIKVLHSKKVRSDHKAPDALMCLYCVLRTATAAA